MKALRARGQLRGSWLKDEFHLSDAMVTKSDVDLFRPSSKRSSKTSWRLSTSRSDIVVPVSIHPYDYDAEMTCRDRWALALLNLSSTEAGDHRYGVSKALVHLRGCLQISGKGEHDLSAVLSTALAIKRGDTAQEDLDIASWSKIQSAFEESAYSVLGAPPNTVNIRLEGARLLMRSKLQPAFLRYIGLKYGVNTFGANQATN